MSSFSLIHWYKICRALQTVVDAYGRKTSVTQSGISSETTYDSLGRVNCVTTDHLSSSSSTDGSTCYGYDAFDRVSQTTQPDGNVYQMSYIDNVVTVTDEVGHQRKLTYDGLGQLASVVEQDDGGALDWETDYQYDGLGRVKQLDQKGGTTNSTQWRTRTWSYNGPGWLLSQTSPEAGTRTFNQYDNNGNLIQTTDAVGNAVTFQYDGLNRVTQKALSTGATHTYKYDAQDGSSDPYGIGRLTSVTTGSNVGEYFRHDAAGNTASESYCLPSDCSYTQTASAAYDFHGNITSLTYPDSRTLAFGYDTSDRLTSETYQSWGAQSVNVPYFNNAMYYPTGALHTASYGNGVGLTASVNSRGSLTNLVYQTGTTPILSKQYNWDKNALNLLSITDNVEGVIRNFTYDYVNRLRSATDTVTGTGPTTPGAGSLTISGQEQAISKTICKVVNGVRRCTPTTVYDTGTASVTVGSFTQSVAYGGASTSTSLASAIEAAFNASSSPVTATADGATLTFTAKAGGSTSDYSLSASVSTSDSTDFPQGSFSTSASGSSLTGGGKGNTLSASYSLDAWGNLKQSGNFSFIQPYATNNQVMAQGYVYDAAGNLTNDGLGNTYNYDAEGKMASSNGAVYTRDALGQRVRKDNGGGSAEYLFFGGRLLATHDPSSGQWLDYIYAGGRLIAENPGSQTACAVFRLGDHLDSLSATTDCAGNISGQNDYAPFGQLVNGSATSRILFTQHERDTENNSDNTLFRQFASAQGRWLSPDPSNGSYDLTDPQSFNRYSYLRNRPLASVDRFGLDDDDDDDDDSGGDGGSQNPPPPDDGIGSTCPPGSPFQVCTGTTGGSPDSGPDLSDPIDPLGEAGSTSLSALLGDIGIDLPTVVGPPTNLPSADSGGGGNDSAGLDVLQTVLAVSGAVPGLNIPANAINAGISIYRHNYGQAAISAAAVFLPGLGAVSEAAQGGEALIEASETLTSEVSAAERYEQAVSEAQADFPNKAGSIEQHHISPKYLGGDPAGPTVPLDAAYHQVVTNAFRAARGYGLGTVSPEELENILNQVYRNFPLPPGTQF